jgi:hypothetical protein
MNTQLSQRDTALIRYVIARRLCPVEILASEFFAADDDDELFAARAREACSRRLRTLAEVGLVWLASVDDGKTQRRVALPGPTSKLVTGVDPKTRRVPVRNRVHHIRTLDALAVLKRDLAKRGARMVDVRLEQDIRADAQQGRRTRPGHQYPSFPDAAFAFEIDDDSGKSVRSKSVAVEYVTSKYRDVDIREKASEFRRFGGAVWVADRGSTAKRVERLVGKRCAVLQ